MEFFLCVGELFLCVGLGVAVLNQLVLLPDGLQRVGQLGVDDLQLGYLDLDPRRTEREGDGVGLLDGDVCNALHEHADLLGGSPCEVDDASTHVGATVVDPHDDRLAVGLVGDLEEAAEGEGAVSAGQRVVVKALATGRATARGAEGVERGLAVL